MPPLRLGLSPVTIPQCSFQQAFEVAAGAGFRGISLRYNLLEDYLKAGHTIADVQELARRSGLVFAEAGFVAEWQYHGGIPLVSQRRRVGAESERADAELRRMHVFFQHCEQLECVNITAAVAVYDSGDPDVAAEDFAHLCDLAKPYGLRMCMEFFGNAPQFRDIASAARLVNKANRPNGGLLIDTFFCHQGASSPLDLENVPIDRIFNVQLADAKPLPRDALDMLRDRLFPGDGVAQLADIVNVLRRRGYDGWWTVELFNPDYGLLDPNDVARRAYSAAMSLLNNPA